MNHFDEKYMKPDLVQELGRIDLIVERIFKSMQSGENLSNRKGFSTEFSEHKNYTLGDDIRHIDWLAYARTDRYYVKQFEAESSLELMIIFDSSPSMSWRYENHISKLEYAANIAAALTALHIKRKDRVGFLTTDEKGERFLAPSSKKQQQLLIYAALEHIKPTGVDQLTQMISSFLKMKRHRGHILLFSDLEEDEGELQNVLSELALVGDKVSIFHLLDFHEVELDLENITHIEDSETGIQIPVHLPSLKKDHAHNIEKFISYWRNLCDKNGIYYHFGHTGQNYAKQIFDFLEKSY